MNGSTTLKNKTIYGFVWSFTELILNQGIQFIIQIILARLLIPEDFGIIGMITVFIALSNSIIDSGFSNALIREKEVTQKDYSTVFHFNLIISVVMYIMLFILSPAISVFFNEGRLISILRILALSIVINSFGMIQRTMLVKKIDFKTQTKISMIASILSGIIGIVVALIGFGVWSLVIRTLFMSLIQSILLFAYNRWIPSLIFDINSFKRLFKFGWKMLVSGLIDTMYLNLYYLIIGKNFSASCLGYYTNASKLKDTVSQSITGAIQKVSYPVLSSIEDGDQNLKKAYKKIIKNAAFIIFPIMIGLAAVGDSFIKCLLGEKWIPSIVYFQILCFEGVMYPIHAINLNILQVKGRSDLFLKLEVIKKIIAVLFIVGALALGFGINGLLLVAVLTSYIDYLINAYYSKELINYSIKEQVKDLFPIISISTLMGILVYLIGIVLPFNNMISLIIQIIIGITMYILQGKIIKSEELNMMLELLIKLFKRIKINN